MIKAADNERNSETVTPSMQAPVSTLSNASIAGISTAQLRTRYIIALLLIALLTIVSNLWMQVLIADQEHDSRVVNIAGRQRMLSQRITKIALLIADARSQDLAARYRNEMTGALGLWRQSHAGLQQGDTSLDLPGDNSEAVKALFAAIEPHFQAMLSAGAVLQEAADGEKARRAVQDLLANEAEFLKGMDSIVFLYDREAKEKVASARLIEMSLMAVTLLVLACEAAFIFAPAIRRIVSDMRELARREEVLALKIKELEEARDELVRSEKMASIGRLVAGFAHELNTPVGVAVGAASHMEAAVAGIDRLMLQEEVSEDELKKELDALKEAAGLTLSNLRRASLLVQSFKRTSIDQQSEAHRDYRLNEVIDDIILNLGGVFKHTGIRIEVNCAARDMLHGDVGAIEQILTNLLMNSYYHAYDEGRQSGLISLQVLENSPGMIDIRYGDDGCGMDEPTLEKIFEPFFTTRRGQGGSGLGLFVTYNLVTQNLRGSIDCASKPGAGAHFHIRYTASVAETARVPPTEVCLT